MMKRKIFSLAAFSSLFLFGGLAQAQGLELFGEESTKFPYLHASVDYTAEEERLGQTMASAGATSKNSILNQLLNVFGFGEGTDYEGQMPKALIYIRFIINLLL